MLTVDKEKREKEREVFLSSLIGESMTRIQEEALEIWKTMPNIGLSFASTLAEGIQKTALLQSVYKKGKIQLFSLSFLLSGAVSNEMFLKMGCLKA